MLHVTAAGWAALVVSVAALLMLDLFVAGRRTAPIALRTAAGWSAFYIGAALAFGVAFGALAGWDLGAQYFAGYLVEKSLSVDNLFVFVIILSAFAVPAQFTSRALTIGIVLALCLRGILIAAGAALIAQFSFMFLIFGVVLLLTAVQLARHRDEDPSIEDNAIVRTARNALPISDRYEGGRVISRSPEGRRLTPMFLVLVAIGSTDVLFALDSIPAVFGVTRHAYIVLAANAFALLGLRALFFLVQGLLARLVYLSAGLAVILALIGVKLILEFAHTQSHGVPEISTGVSLMIIAIVLVLTTWASLIKSRRDPAARAHGGRLRGQRRSAGAPDGPARPRAAIAEVDAGAGADADADVDADADAGAIADADQSGSNGTHGPGSRPTSTPRVSAPEP